jgi:hypothetical protein
MSSRLVAVAAFAASCSSSHPSSTQDAAIDGARDAVPDVAQGSGCPPAAFHGPATTVGTADAPEIALPSSLAFAISATGADGTLYVEQPPSGSAAAIAAFTSTQTVGWDHPALRSDGNELFAREINTSTIWSSTQVGGVWGMPVQATGPWFSDSVPGGAVAVGTTGDLRAMIWGDTQLQEYTRTGGVWTAVGSALTPTELIGQAAMLASPQLSSDGLSLVFLANPGGPSLTVWYTHRATVSAAFTLPATPIYGPATAIYSPYLTADCRDLYLSENGVLVRLGP